MSEAETPESSAATARKPLAGWVIWASTGSLGGAIAGAALAGKIPTSLGPMAADPGLPGWAWSGINGALVGLQGGVACALWQRVRQGTLGKPLALGLIVLVSASILTFSFCLTSSIASLATGQPALLPTAETLPRVFWGNLPFGCALLGALMGHVADRAPVTQIVGAWFMTILFFMPLGALGIMIHGGEPSADFFWRAGFPYYGVLPISWWLAARFWRDPLPVLEVAE